MRTRSAVRAALWLGMLVLAGCVGGPQEPPGVATSSKGSSNEPTRNLPFGVPTHDPHSGSVSIYISDQAECENDCERNAFELRARVIRIDDLTGANWTEFGTLGDGVGQFNFPAHLKIGPDGKIYIADTQNDRVVRMDDMTGAGWTTLDMSDDPGETLGLAFDSKGRLYIADSSRIVRVDDIRGAGSVTYGVAHRPPGGVGEFYKLKAVGLDAQDRVYGIDAGNYRVVRIDDMSGTGWVAFGRRGSGAGEFEEELNGVTVDAQGRVYVADEHNNRIVRVDDMAGNGWAEFRGLPGDPLVEPHDVALTSAGQIYILDSYAHRVVRIDDFEGSGWLAFAPNWRSQNWEPGGQHPWYMAAPHGMTVVEW